MIEREQKPLAVNVGEVIWIDEALLDALLPGFAIGQLQLPARHRGLGELIENPQVQNRFGARAKGDGLRHVVKAEPDSVRQGLLHLLAGAEQRLFEAGAPVLLKSPLGYDQREDFAFGDLKRGEVLDGFSVEIAKPAAVVLDRQLQSGAHELQ